MYHDIFYKIYYQLNNLELYIKKQLGNPVNCDIFINCINYKGIDFTVLLLGEPHKYIDVLMESPYKANIKVIEKKEKRNRVQRIHFKDLEGLFSKLKEECNEQ